MFRGYLLVFLYPSQYPVPKSSILLKPLVGGPQVPSKDTEKLGDDLFIPHLCPLEVFFPINVIKFHNKLLGNMFLNKYGVFGVYDGHGTNNQ